MRGGAIFFEFSGCGEDPVLEGADGLVIGFDGAVEAAADLIEMVDEDADPVIEDAAQLADFVGVFDHGFLAPSIGDRS